MKNAFVHRSEIWSRLSPFLNMLARKGTLILIVLLSRDTTGEHFELIDIAVKLTEWLFTFFII